MGIFLPNFTTERGFKIAYRILISLLYFLVLVGWPLLRKVSLQIFVLLLIYLSFLISYLIFILKSFTNIGLDSGQVYTITAILVAAFTVFVGTTYKQSLDVEKKKNSRFVPVYEEFVDLLNLYKNTQIRLEKKLKSVSKIDMGIYKWRNYRVRKCWNEIRSESINEELLNASIEQKVTDLLLEMRRQVGHPEERDSLTKDFIRAKIKPPNGIRQHLDY